MALTDTSTILKTSDYSKRFTGDGVPSTHDASGLVGEIARRRARIVRPLFVASFAFYLTSLVALAYFPGLVTYRLYGSINLAYALAITQFVMTFLVAFIYARQTSRLVDPVVKRAFALLGPQTVEGEAR